MSNELTPNENDSILITGGTGLVGSALARELKSLGFSNVTTIGRNACNLLDPTSVRDFVSTIAPKYVFHMAARVHGLGGNAKYKSDVLVENTLMNLNVIEASRVSGVEKIVAMGSGCVYPDLGNTEELTEDLLWTGAPHPSEDSYGHSKRLMLAHLDAAQKQFGLSSAFVISGNMYGPGDNFNTEDGHVIPSLVAKFHQARKDGVAVKAWGTGAAIRDFTHADDMAQALVKIWLGVEGPINAGSGFRHAIREIVEVLSEHTGVEVDWETSKPDGQLVRYYNLDKLMETGYQPRVHLSSGVIDTYEWYVSNFPNIRK